MAHRSMQRAKSSGEREVLGEFINFERLKLKEGQKNYRERLKFNLLKMQKYASVKRKACALSALNRAGSAMFWGCLPTLSA